LIKTFKGSGASRAKHAEFEPVLTTNIGDVKKTA